MSDIRVASRYAKSIFELAEEREEIEQVASDMRLLRKVIQENRDLSLVIKNPVVSQEKKLQILKIIFQDKMHPMTISLFEIMIRKNRIEILPELAEAFHELYKHKHNIVEATLTTTVSLDESLRQKFSSVVKQATGADQIFIEEEIDPDLIGGYILRINDRQIDDSIKTRLKELRINLLES